MGDSPGEDQPTVADVIVARLRDWGVDRIFGYSGDGRLVHTR